MERWCLQSVVDLLAARRRDCDILWASRPTDPLSPHKLPSESKYSRDKIIQTVLYDEKVQSAIFSLAAARQTDKKIIFKQAYTIIHEMASKAHLATVRWIGVIVTKVLKRIFVSIYINENAVHEMKREMQISQVQYVYVPTHRSYLDFILLSYVLFSYDMALPNIASGMDFYRMYVIGELLRKTGAFYMRRSFSDDLLYKKIFAAYVTALIKHSDRAIEFFIEGTRSRSLKSLSPKFGLLSVVLDGLLEGNVPDIYFVPISINYERPPEELLFVYELLGVPKPKETTAGLFRSLSILQKPHAYGNIVINVGEPISTCQFMSMEQRKARVLSPYAKFPASVTEGLAYSIVDSHKKNTILVPFNLIALLFNERSQIYPGDPYTTDDLISDYFWCKQVLQVFGAIVHQRSDDEPELLLNTLKPHEELIAFDESNILRLKERHRTSGTGTIVARVKGHALSEITMKIAVPVINISIYLNPTLAFLMEPAIVVVAIGIRNDDDIELGIAFERYALLRMLLSTEFAMPLVTDICVIKSEWERILNLLLERNYISIQNDTYVRRKDLKVLSLLYNVMLPFIDTIYITCLVLFEWNETESEEMTTEMILVRVQKLLEESFLDGRNDWGRHPYSLSLDLINTTISNLVKQDILMQCKSQNVYRVDKVRLALIVGQLQNLPLERPIGLYLKAVLLPASLPTSLVSAKL